VKAKAAVADSGETKPLPPVGLELVHQLLRDARDAGASDPHLKAGMSSVVRVHGALRELPYPPLPPEVCEASLLAVLDE